jgi:lipid-binding SYLF domain-containing protein
MHARHFTFLTLALALIFLPPAPVSAAASIEARTDEAVRVLREIMQSPDHRIPRDLLRDAEAVAVIPDVVKAGFVIGGRHGRGLIAVRGADGAFSNPSFVSLTGGSIGFQAGVQSTDVILVFRTRRGVDGVVNGKFTLGADASVAAGPVGRNAALATDAALQAEIYSYSRSRGLFAGVALDGAVLRIDDDANSRAYGSGVTPRRIFEGGAAPTVDRIVDFRDALEEYSQ